MQEFTKPTDRIKQTYCDNGTELAAVSRYFKNPTTNVDARYPANTRASRKMRAKCERRRNISYSAERLKGCPLVAPSRETLLLLPEHRNRRWELVVQQPAQERPLPGPKNCLRILRRLLAPTGHEARVAREQNDEESLSGTMSSLEEVVPETISLLNSGPYKGA